MSKKLSFEQMKKSVEAVNSFRDCYGRKFSALVTDKTWEADRSKVYTDETVYIGKGRYNDHNMPNVTVRDEQFDCQCVVIENNGSCLTIKLDRRTIDIMPNDVEEN